MGNLKIIYEKFKYLAIYIVKELFYFVPFVILSIIGYHFISYKYGYAEQTIRYYIMFAATGLTASISGLALSASRSSIDNEKKECFNYAGERLLHSTILFAVAIALEYTETIIRTTVLNKVLSIMFLFIVGTPRFLFMFFGIIYIVLALSRLHRVLIKGHEKPLD